MRLRGGQARFLCAAIASWIGLRLCLVLIGGVAPVMPPRLAAAPLAGASAPWSAPASVRPASFARIAAASDTIAAVAERAPAANARGRARPDAIAMVVLGPTAPAPPTVSSLRPRPPPAGSVVAESDRLAAPIRPPDGGGKARSRWSASGYVFIRPGSGRASLAAGGELGGSQVAARVAYRLNRGDAVRTAVAARLYAPLNARGAEAAVGLDYYPIKGVPVRVSVERRIDLDGRGRNAWSAYAAGGFTLETLAKRVTVDGYAQAGVVGAERRDLFVDGAIRAGHRVRLRHAALTVGGGLWGAAQPDVARLDVGPRIAVDLPVAGGDVSVAVEGRLRVAGRAAPGSGAALTIAAQF